MWIEEIIRDESPNIEFKLSLPKDSEKYVKTIIAFANTQGGQLIVGVDDKTREIKGVAEDILFRTMDSISNAVSDSCEPQIVPSIEPYTIDGKTIIIVTVVPEPHRPYYLKSKGKERGTYIRVAATSRIADQDKIRELELEGERISWDELNCVGYRVTENAIKQLCRDINKYRKEMQERRELFAKLPIVTRVNLENWHILKKMGEGYLASNAFALLTGEHFRYSKTQCAVFAGTERGEFIDKQDYTGPLYEQIEKAYAFVLRNIRKSAKVDGLIRRESYELPLRAVREMIVNAHCHRNFMDESCVQVALYEDRLEVTSPGGLCHGLTLAEALSGRSRQRNRAVAEVFSQMGLIEAWGNGLRSICADAEEYELPKPEFIEMPETFRVNLYRKPLPMTDKPNDGEPSAEHWQNVGESLAEYRLNIDEASVKHRQNIGGASVEHRRNIGGASVEHRRNIGDTQLNDTQRKIVEYLLEDNTLTGAALAEKIGISKRNIENNIKKLKDMGMLVRHGFPKGGYWEVKEK
ncbi:MAG: putative DNA binding domain-containing protein [Lachnospiraceae bacterium]|nr:putative DNA binding domain-containing protein [Lachnospiraceae bacterium]